MAWKPPDNTAEVDRLMKLMSHYEIVNLDQMQRIESLNQTHEANAKRILELDKNRVLLQKNIKSLEGRMKFDKIAADGIKKKFNLLEIEVRDLKLANDQMSAERNEHVAKIAQLEEDLNNNRSDKLKFMHENSNLKKQNAVLTSSENAADKDAVFARKDLLEKLEMLDHVLQTNETFKRTIESQSAEMLMASHNVYDLNEKLKQTRLHVVNLEAMSAEYNHTIDVLQHEISRLRKELMDASTGVSGQSSAVLSRSGASNRSNRIATNIIQSSYAFDGDDGAYALSRRPRTEQGLSRERNKLSSSGSLEGGTRGLGHSRSGVMASQYSTLSEGSYGGASSGLPSLPEVGSTTAGRVSTAAAGGSRRDRTPSRGIAQGAHTAPATYQYKDITEHLHVDKPHATEKGAVIVDGGKISISGGVQQTVRAHILQGHEGVVASPDRLARAAEADALMRGVNSPDLRAPLVDSLAHRSLHSTQSAPPGSLHSASLGAASSHTLNAAFGACRPISTPFRPKSDSLSAKAALPSPGTHHTSSAGNMNTSIVKNAVAQLQDCYTDHGKKYKNKTISTSLSRSNDAADEHSNNHHASRAAAIPLGYLNNGSELNSRALSPMTVESADLGATSELALPNDDAAERTRAVTFGHSTELSLSVGEYEKRGKKASSKAGASGKSLFVGSGLGLRHNAKLDAELKNLNKGSTQQILRKILGDRFD